MAKRTAAQRKRSAAAKKGWITRRIEAERIKRTEAIKRRAIAARKGARTRWLKKWGIKRETYNALRRGEYDIDELPDIIEELGLNRSAAQTVYTIHHSPGKEP